MVRIGLISSFSGLGPFVGRDFYIKVNPGLFGELSSVGG